MLRLGIAMFIKKSRGAFNNKLVLFGVISLVYSLSACTPIYRTSGNVIADFAEGQMVPYVLTRDDTDMACETGISLNYFITSFGHVGASVEKLAIFQNSLAAFCSDELAAEAEADYYRALYKKDALDAKDSLVRLQRLRKLSAKRQYQAYLDGQAVFSERDADGCPVLETDIDELSWLMSLMSGFQSAVNDMNSGGIGLVPLNVPTDVVAGSECLDNEKWWGFPQSLKAGFWAISPAVRPKGVDPWKVLNRSLDLGEAKGVVLASAAYLIAAYSVNDEARMRYVIKRVSQSRASHPDFVLVDELARSHLLWGSDRMWIRATGSRTPIGKFGHFWDEKNVEQLDIDLDDIL